MKKPTSQFMNSILILVGGTMLLFQIAAEERNVYVMVIGLIFLMFGLYRATNFWVDTKDDHKMEQEEETEDNKLQ